MSPAGPVAVVCSSCRGWAGGCDEQLLPGGGPGPRRREPEGGASRGTSDAGCDGDQLRPDGRGGGLGVEASHERTDRSGEVNAIATSISQAGFAMKFPDGMCASGPALRSAMTYSMIACRR